MNIEEKIHNQKCSFIKKNYRRPEYLYLGYEEYAELRAVTGPYRQYTYQPYQSDFKFNGLEVIVVASRSHLNFGFKDE